MALAHGSCPGSAILNCPLWTKNGERSRHSKDGCPLGERAHLGGLSFPWKGVGLEALDTVGVTWLQQELGLWPSALPVPTPNVFSLLSFSPHPGDVLKTDHGLGS